MIHALLKNLQKMKTALTRTGLHARPHRPTTHDWAYDQYHSQVVTARRWQLAFWVQTGGVVLMAVAMTCLFPLKTWDPIVIHRNTQTGEVWAEHARAHALPESSAETESDLVRYVIARETVAHADTEARHRQVIFTSSPTVSTAYRATQNSLPVQQLQAALGENGTRAVTVQDIVFLDTDGAGPSPTHRRRPTTHLAKIDFVTTDSNPGTEKPLEKAWVATVRWTYVGTPDTKAVAWENWNGFMVTDYRVDQRNL